MITTLKDIRIISITRTYLNNTEPTEHWLEMWSDLNKEPIKVPIKSQVWTPEYAIFHTSDDKYILEYDQGTGLINLMTMARVKFNLEEIKETFGITKENILL